MQTPSALPLGSDAGAGSGSGPSVDLRLLEGNTPKGYVPIMPKDEPVAVIRCKIRPGPRGSVMAEPRRIVASHDRTAAAEARAIADNERWAEPAPPAQAPATKPKQQQPPPTKPPAPKAQVPATKAPPGGLVLNAEEAEAVRYLLSTHPAMRRAKFAASPPRKDTKP